MSRQMGSDATPLKGRAPLPGGGADTAVELQVRREDADGHEITVEVVEPERGAPVTAVQDAMGKGEVPG